MRGLQAYVANDSTRNLIGHVCGTQHGPLGRPADQFGQLDARWTIPHKNKYVE